MRSIHSTFILLCLLSSAPALSCGGGGSGGSSCAEPTYSVAGCWFGTWSGGTDSGTLFWSLNQSGSKVEGSVSMGGSPCFEIGSLSGEMCGENFEFEMTNSNGSRFLVTGSFSGGGPFPSFGLFEGSWDYIEDAFCSKDIGTLVMETSECLTSGLAAGHPDATAWVTFRDGKGGIFLAPVTVPDALRLLRADDGLPDEAVVEVLMPGMRRLTAEEIRKNAAR
ncbi:MAG: hypothetical protein RL277_643 [Planctomycetota bacterium]|jgi:hypothetical protein